MGAIKWLLFSLMLVGSAQAQTITPVIPHQETTATTSPIPSSSCMYVDQALGGGSYGNSKLCPANASQWFAAFGFSSFSNGTPVKLLGVDGANNPVFGPLGVQDVALTPGLTTAVGTCNTSVQHIGSGASGQINQQECIRPVTASTAGALSDSGWVVKMNCNGCIYTAINPSGSGGNQGVFFDIKGDGNPSDSFIVTTAGHTANFQGCPSGGSTSMTLPGNVEVILRSDNDGTNNYYDCFQGNGTITITNNYSGATIVLSTQTASVGVTTSLDFTPLSTSYRQLRLECNNITLSSSSTVLHVYSGQGGGPTWNTAASYVRLRFANSDVGGLASSANNADTDYISGAITNLVSTIPAMFSIRMNRPDVTGYKLSDAKVYYVSAADGTYAYQYEATSYWGADTNTLTGLQVAATGGGTFGGQCTLLGDL